ncbi:MAG TPA: DNA methyltransferase [Allosphingosinicella sp.]|nr:DNA methyltransferase [Allosphingosinicella sp.]
MARQTRMDLPSEDQTVTCLGQTFESDEARREHFRALLRERLADPAFRSIPGFPEGSIDDIVKMSDPPFYTACPNPFIREALSLIGKPYEAGNPYSRPPLALDASVGKTDALYKAHGYHTKVPHHAIVPSILHYTSPGEIVLDAFGGSGMTAVAAAYCGMAPAAYRTRLEAEAREAGRDKPEWGRRYAVLNDLSPAATFIASNYVSPFDQQEFSLAAAALLDAVEREIGWMYETTLSNGDKARIEYTVWSEIFSCQTCGYENVFTDSEQSDADGGRAKIICSGCGASERKEDMTMVIERFLDPGTGEINWRPKRVPSLIIYKKGKQKLSKVPGPSDLALIERINGLPLPPEVPTDALPDTQMSNVGRMKTTNTQAIHHFFLPRAAQAMACLWRNAHAHREDRVRRMLVWSVEQAIWGLTVLARYVPSHFSQVNQYMSGVFYVGSQHAECSPWYILDGKFSRLASAFNNFKIEEASTFISVGDASHLRIDDNSIDYIFTDPPFGSNIYYSDLNFLVEAWHGVKTAPAKEAIVDPFKEKDIGWYQDAMQSCFAEYARVLKPGKWMTVVFSNSKAAVWNSIQVALQQAGFIVAEVTALDKKQGSFKQVTSANAVKQDLVVSCYKPNGGLEDRFESRGVTDDTAWDFMRTHLKNLAVVKRGKASSLEMVAERDPRRLFDRMVAWFVRHNTPVPLSSAEFQAGLAERFPERDGMFFLPNQIDEYDRARMQAGDPPQRDLFVDDERTAIEWLADFLKAKPSTSQEVHPEFTKKTGAGWRKHEVKPELLRLLDENFLKYDGQGPVPSQIHGYLSSNWRELRNLEKDDSQLVQRARNRWYVPDPNKQQDVEARREKALLREFDVYKAHKGKKLKEIRLEVMRAGFKTAWAAKDYRTIIDVSAKVPEEVWQEDERLMMLHSMAETRLAAER